MVRSGTKRSCGRRRIPATTHDASKPNNYLSTAAAPFSNSSRSSEKQNGDTEAPRSDGKALGRKRDHRSGLSGRDTHEVHTPSPTIFEFQNKNDAIIFYPFCIILYNRVRILYSLPFTGIRNSNLGAWRHVTASFFNNAV